MTPSTAPWNGTRRRWRPSRAEVLERPGPQDVAGLARRYASESATVVVVIGPDGRELTPSGLITGDPSFARVIQAARDHGPGAGEIKGMLYASQVLGAGAGPAPGGSTVGPAPGGATVGPAPGGATVGPAPGGATVGRASGGATVGSNEARGIVLVARSDETVDHRVHRFWMLLVLLAGGVLTISLAVSSRLGRWVADPLRRLEGQAALLGAGDLTARADARSGPPEVAALALAFNDMADRLDELVRSQRRFVADASHQLRGPLTALRLRLENLDERDPLGVAATRDAALAETTRVTRLVDGLLSLARAEGHRPEREPVDVGAVVAGRRDAWAPLAAEQGVDLRVVVGDLPLRALIVPGHLDQILDNLIDNALEASPEGASVELRVLDAGTHVEVHVRDEGPGMSDAERVRAFDPFWQGPSSQANGGTGLGLAIAGQLARTSRGSITLESNGGWGVDATVRFPVAGD